MAVPVVSRLTLFAVGESDSDRFINAHTGGTPVLPSLDRAFSPRYYFSLSRRWSPTRMALAMAVSAGFTAPMLGKNEVSTT